ncbi:MAG: methyltransferase domain-containing protein [Gemmatimonadaceae bacterium]
MRSDAGDTAPAAPPAAGADPEVDAATSDLRRRFRTTESNVDVGGPPLRILHPQDADALIDEDEFDVDERLPYWADIWPSSVVLARHIRRLRGGPRLLELGCGAGVVATAATLAGFTVTATDYYADAIAFTHVNVWRNTGQVIDARVADWRSFPLDLADFDVVVASDVLYEPRYADLVAATFRRTLGRRGVGYVADPGRIAVDDFVHRCRSYGLVARTLDRIAFATGTATQTISLFEVTRG